MYEIKDPSLCDWLAATTAEGVVQDRLSDFKKAKESTLEILPTLYDSTSNLKKHCAKIEECGSYMVFRVYFTKDISKVIRANLCKKALLCDLCALRKSALRVQQFSLKLSQVMEESPQLVPYLVTYTVLNGADIGTQFDHLIGSYRKLARLRREDLSRGTRKTITRNVLGGSYQVEVKIGSGSGLWHCHIHSIIMVPKGLFGLTEIERKKKVVKVPLGFENRLRSEWKEITGDSHMVDVRLIETENDQSRFGAICEAHKYALKPGNLTPEQRIEAAEYLSGKQLYGTYGNLRGIKIRDDLMDSIEEELQLLPYIDMVYTYNKDGYVLKGVTDYGDDPFNLNNGNEKESKKKNSHPF